MTTMTTSTDTYLFERRTDLGDLERRRLHAIAALFDPATRRLLQQLGVGPGWRCLEVGAGAGSVAAWLARQVGPEGEVLATDVDLTHLDALPPAVTYAEHDIVTDSLPDEAFDVVHARLLLEHLSGRETALDRMASAVRPGGYLLVEEAEMSPQALDLVTRYQPLAGRPLGAMALRAVAALLAAAGADMGYASTLPAAVRRAGLELVGGEIHSPIVRGGAAQDFGRLTVMVLRDPLVASGLLTHDEIDAFLRMTLDPESQYVPFVMTSVWARRPA
jgi:SAM-dependent methyltransferase